jgi:hypothetical protein
MMQAIHNPAAELRQSLQSDIESFLKGGGKIKIEPLKKTPVKACKQFSLNTSKKEFEEVQLRTKKDSKETAEVKYCKASGLYHIYQGSLKISRKGFYSEQTARMQAAKTQEQINLEARMKAR